MIDNDNDYSVETAATVLNILLNCLYCGFWTFDCCMRFEDIITRKSKKRVGKEIWFSRCMKWFYNLITNKRITAAT